MCYNVYGDIMKAKKILSIVIPISIICIVVLGIIIYFTSKNLSNIGSETCDFFTGGSFNIKFNTNGGNNISDMSVCIACSPDSYDDLPIPEKEEYIFDGWYYDEELSNRIEFTNSFKFNPIPEYSKDGCLKGYKDIEIYAKWKKA